MSKLRRASFLIIENDDKEILTFKKTGFDSRYHLPGGKLSSGETSVSALTRELREELEFSGLLEVRRLAAVVFGGEMITVYHTRVKNDWSVKLGPNAAEEGLGEPVFKNWIDAQPSSYAYIIGAAMVEAERIKAKKEDGERFSADDAPYAIFGVLG